MSQGRPKGLPKTGGRQIGTHNKTKLHAIEIVKMHAKTDPLIVLCQIMDRDEKALGYEGPQIKYGKDGMIIETPWITPEMRMEAAKTLAKKIYPDLKAVELSGDEKNPIHANITVTKDLLLELAKKAHDK